MKAVQGGRRTLSVVIAAGGLGGHIYPGLALAETIRRAVPAARITFVGTRRGLEGRLVPQAGYPLRTVDMVPLTRGNGLRFPAALLRSVAQCQQVIKRTQAQVAVGMGGYSSAPLIAAARLAGIKSLVHDSNAIPGRANRFSTKFTDNVALAFDEAERYLPDSVNRRIVGMPLSADLARYDRDALRPAARAALGLAEDTVLVLVNGGSLGATRLNHAAVDLAARWRDRTDVRLLIKAGQEGVDELNRRITAAGAERVAQAVDYFDRMDHVYAASDLAVCRAGAATVAELRQVGLPAVLVPYPHAADDHQTRNARALVDIGAAVLLPDAEVTAERLETLVGGLVATPLRRAEMAEAAQRGGRSDAAEQLASWVLELAGLPVTISSPTHV
ncbi:undecaprenyldiphospho-muramoylpentapeptide beta-N-acetylglucosaminyltransferase [Goodfellowiella coeruleoviolacea]|uniref:UDP-N-acetylglucosamine--N-acetylmuramyl-(pentapeptide) pyrophosphoryl-undecaprenol N-acetylglucosamine transferase n=1 Tax=Goodfellowiella coeruleoviolacea TaxID=334858 RepID=A0AAE3KJN8_9PSEU|nr:undecaprenyldiphospho-muramoylpentapeptide beta-N-acetylglucosaminyltransferase [Goodfellowiella coeruleoviolacea]MCP2169835.1 UDP-N-acetylglucosamine-N-acetylmuramylpentapeptide N-acetylglucosamine transferase [Goodfellowiella coeruleoviolacea]